MAADAHWIGSIAFELRTTDAAALDPARAVVRTELQSAVVAPLQQALDRAERAGCVTRHRRIEVDLGRFAAREVLGGGLARRIAKALDGLLARGAWPESGIPAPTADDEADQLAAFLASGVLAWAAPGEALSAICAALLARDAPDLARLAEQLRAVLASVPAAAERLVRQCPAAMVRRIAAALAESAFAAFAAPAAPAAPATRAAPAAAAADEAHEPVPDAMAVAWAKAIKRLARGERADAADAAVLFGATSGSAASAATSASGSGNERDEGISEAARLPIARRSPSAREQGANEGGGAARSDEEAVQTAAPVDEAAPRALPIGAAGAVLLHPFLSGLFGSVGLLGDDGDFRGPAARARGALLLHFIATGREEAPEPDLPLLKLLCGMDFGAVVPRRLDSTEAERAEADALLGAVIAHWDALGETSAAALRETFLQRPGRLQRAGEDWRLVVEPRGVDVLLDRLPWSVGMVRTRFMARLLRVEWR